MKVELDTLYYTEQDNIAYIVINMPPANIMTPKHFDELATVIMDYAVRTKKDGIVVTGEGRHFSSGADVDLLIESIHSDCIQTSENRVVPPERNRKLKTAFCRLYQCSIPVVSVIRGFCIGSGYELALHTHIRIAEKGARVGLPETTFGLLPGIGGSIRCIEEIGYKKALECILTGELIGSEDALEMHLVDTVTKKKCGYELAVEFIHYVKEHVESYSCEQAAERLQQFMQNHI